MVNFCPMVNWWRKLSLGEQIAIVGVIVAVLAIIVGLFQWLHPVGPDVVWEWRGTESESDPLAPRPGNFRVKITFAIINRGRGDARGQEIRLQLKDSQPILGIGPEGSEIARAVQDFEPGKQVAVLKLNILSHKELVGWVTYISPLRVSINQLEVKIIPTER